LTTKTLRLLTEEVIVRNQKFKFKAAKSPRERNSSIGWLVAISFAWLMVEEEVSVCPVSYAEAIHSNEQEQWLRAIHEELTSPYENETRGARK
jgi:hypothetical protein